MNANRQPNGMTSLQGNLLRLPAGREIAIYLRGGAAWVADFHNSRVRLHSASEWHATGGGRALAYSQRRGEVETISPLPDDTERLIEALHRRAEAPVVGPAVRRLFGPLAAIIHRGAARLRARAAAATPVRKELAGG